MRQSHDGTDGAVFRRALFLTGTPEATTTERTLHLNRLRFAVRRIVRPEL